MSDRSSTPCSAFEGHVMLQSGPLTDVAVAVKRAVDAGSREPILVFEDDTGAVVDLDLRGTEAEVRDRLAAPRAGPAGRFSGQPDTAAAAPTEDPPKSKGRGRPKLGVVAREVTLLPRQWEWLAAQRGGASATLRRLVDAAKRRDNPRGGERAARDAAYRFMQAIAGDFPGFEEAMRALYRDDRDSFERQTAAWPHDIRKHAQHLAFGRSAPTPDAGTTLP